MCGRFTLHTPESRIREAFHLEQTAPLGLSPRFNIAPSQQVPIIRATETQREMVLPRWGLIPHWSKEPKTKYSTINARIESVAEKPAYRIPFNRRRGLIPADGYYEWKAMNDKKVPHYIRLRDGDVFAIAGLWDRWEGASGSLESCSIIVIPADGMMKSLHERMPAIIAPAHYGLWLDARITDKAEIMDFLNSAPSSQLVTYPINPWVSLPKHDDERCIEPAGDM